LILSTAGCSFGLSGGDGINISGNESTSSITIGLDGSVVRGILADTGNATGSGHWLHISGAGNVSTSASGNTLTITSIGGGSVDLSLPEGFVFIGNSSGLAAGVQITGDASLNSLGEIDVTWSDECQSADTANSAVDSDKLDGLHGSSYLLGNATAADSDKLDGQHGSYFAIAGSGVTSVVAGTGISVSANVGNVTITNTAPDTLLSSKMIFITKDLANASGSTSYSGVGFRPTSLEVMASKSGQALSTGGGSIGLADSLLNQGCWLLTAGIFYPHVTDILEIDVAAGKYQYASLSSYDSDGFTFAWVKVGLPTGSGTVIVKCYR
jgi:hypothetical protein